MRRRVRSRRVVVAAVAGVFLTVSAFAQQDLPDALELYRAGEYTRAVEVTLQELERSPRNMNSYTVLGWSLIALGRYQDALRYGAAGLAISPSDHRIVQIIGEAHYRAGNYASALEYLERYVVIAPSGLRIGLVYYHMGEILIQFAEHHAADIALTTAVHHVPNNAEWWARLGFARESAQEYPHALAAYDRALSINAAHSAAIQGRTRVRNIVD